MHHEKQICVLLFLLLYILKITAQTLGISSVVSIEPQFRTIYNTSFQALLLLDTDSDVGFQCQATVAASLQEALQQVSAPDCAFLTNATTTVVTTSPTTVTTIPTTIDDNVTLPTVITTPPPILDPGSAWLATSNIAIQAAFRYGVVRVTRERQVVAPVQEIVVTTCCASVGTQSVAAVTVADLAPRLNTTGGVTSGNPGEERFIIKPAYQEVAPCPCDLTFGKCDLGCCCDGECSDADKRTFDACIPGTQGGQDRGPDLRSCLSGHFPKDDWFPAMCVQFESNAYLGEFYSVADKLTSLSAIRAKLQEEQKSNHFSYREAEERYSDLLTVSNYTQGTNIITLGAQNAIGNLPLPHRRSSPQCLDSSPVQFLKDSDSACVRLLDQQSCVDLTPFSARVYALSDPSFSVSSNGGLNQKVNVSVDYLCADNAFLGSYIPTGATLHSNSISTFPPGLEDANCSDPCGAGSTCLNDQIVADDAAVPPPPPCSFVLPPAPSVNVGVCQNVVLDVEYRFAWSGGVLTAFNATVILGDVPLNGGSVSLSQKFRTVFVHDYAGPTNQSDNYLNVSTPYRRSGRPGYDYGGGLASGCSGTNISTGAALPIDQSQHKQMAVWSPGADGLCLNTRRRFLTFGDNVQSNCAVRLTMENISNCDSLKQLVWNHLNALMPSNVIGRFGYNSPNIQEMWIPVLREDPFASDAATPSTTVSPLTTEPPTDTSPDSTTSAGVTESPASLLSVREGVCRDVISGVHLQVMYADTGRNKGYPLREVVGAAVSFTRSNWSMSCVGLGAGRCQIGSTLTQPFLLSSSVQYTQVSASAPGQEILFYRLHSKETCDSDSCYRFFHDFDTSRCHYDTCWQELLYPLMNIYRGYEGTKYTRAFTLVFAVFVLGYVTVSKPWR